MNGHRHYIHAHEPSGHVHEPWIPYAVDHDTQTDFATGGEVPWDLPSSWDGGHVPDVTGMIRLDNAKRVLRGEVRFRNLVAENGGGLIFDPNENVRVVCDTIQIINGIFRMGSENPAVKHELIFDGPPIDLEFDPGTFTRGLLCYNGAAGVGGAVQARTFVRVTEDPEAGANVLRIEGNVPDWLPGDRIFIPDGRATSLRPVEDIFRDPRWEEAIIDRVEPGRIFLRDPLVYDHPAGRHPGTSKVLHIFVMNLSRNTVIRTGDDGMDDTTRRGHTMCIGRCAVDWRYTEFRDMGRSRAADLSSTVFGSDGEPHVVGSNQKGRYGVHLHHCLGPRGGVASAGGRQFNLKGLSGWNTNMPAPLGVKWFMSVHNAHWGNVNDCVGCKWAGTVFLLGEHGNESHNDYSRNYGAACDGTHSAGQRGGDQVDFGHEGSIFWCAGVTDCILDDWVAADAGADGVNMYGFSNPHDLHMQIPISQGDDPYVDGQYYTRAEGLRVRSHTVFASAKRWRMHNGTNGLFNWGIAGYGHHYIEDAEIWNTTAFGYRDAYHSGQWFRNCTFMVDPECTARTVAAGLYGGNCIEASEAAGVALINCNIYGYHIGASIPELSTLDVAGGEWITLSERVTLRPDGARYEGPAEHRIRFGNPWRPGMAIDVYKYFSTPIVRQGRTDYFTRSRTILERDDGVFQVYYQEQGEGFTYPPGSDPHRVQVLAYARSVSGGAPFFGHFTPTGTTTIPGVEGVVLPLSTPPPPPDNEIAPVIRDLVVSFTPAGDAAVHWTTDEDALTGWHLIEAGVDGIADQEPYGTTLTRTHLVTLAGLTPAQWYEFTAKAKDASGNESSAPVGFQVPGGKDPPPPPDDLKISGMTTFADHGNISLVFDTSLPAFGQVVYGRVSQQTPMPDATFSLEEAPLPAGRSLRGTTRVEQHVTVIAKPPGGSYWWIAYAYGPEGAEAMAGPQAFTVSGP